MHVYQQRYAKRRKAVLGGFIVVATLLMVVVFYQSQTLYPLFLVAIFLPLMVLFRMQRVPPLRFDEQGVAWGYELYNGKALPRLGFVYWQDIVALDWQVQEKGGGSVVVRFYRGALRTHFPHSGTAMPAPHHGEVVEVELLLFMLDADSAAVFAAMQQCWQQVHGASQDSGQSDC